MHKKMQLWGSWHRLVRAVKNTCLFHLITESCDLVLKAVIMSKDMVSLITEFRAGKVGKEW
jgi:hypothetical protein